MSSTKKWIWEQEDYPNFTYDSKAIEPLIQKVSQEQGYLIAFTSMMNDENLKQRQFEALTNEAMSTSAIEGEHLNRDSVKASIRRKLGLVTADDKKRDEVTDNLIAILIDANTNYEDDLTLERIFGWHNAMFPKGYSGFDKINVAQFRGEETMEVISGPIGKEKTYYVAPPRNILEKEMSAYLQWFNDQEASLIKAAIAHLWFVVIHPLDDGNGRITRAITDLLLSNIESSQISRLYSMSSAINKERSAYYEALEATTGYKVNKDPMDITVWCKWFLNTLHSALYDTKQSLNHILQKTSFWDKHKESNLNARQTKVLNKILDMGVENFQGGLNKRKYVAMAKTTSSTASRDIAELIEKGCIAQVEGSTGRATSYVVVL